MFIRKPIAFSLNQAYDCLSVYLSDDYKHAVGEE
jgi:hypothetical protein